MKQYNLGQEVARKDAVEFDRKKAKIHVRTANGSWFAYAERSFTAADHRKYAVAIVSQPGYKVQLKAGYLQARDGGKVAIFQKEEGKYVQKWTVDAASVTILENVKYFKD